MKKANYNAVAIDCHEANPYMGFIDWASLSDEDLIIGSLLASQKVNHWLKLNYGVKA